MHPPPPPHAVPTNVYMLPLPTKTRYIQMEDASPPPPKHQALRKRRPRKSTWLMGKMANSVFDLHIPQMDFTV